MDLTGALAPDDRRVVLGDASVTSRPVPGEEVHQRPIAVGDAEAFSSGILPKISSYRPECSAARAPGMEKAAAIGHQAEDGTTVEHGNAPLMVRGRPAARCLDGLPDRLAGMGGVPGRLGSGRRGITGRLISTTSAAWSVESAHRAL